MIRSILWQLLHATAYLHSRWIMHRDIKPTNILIFDNTSHSGLVKLTDFGLARSFQEPVVEFSELERVVVTLWFRAPELLLGYSSYGPAVDIWAIGCVLGRVDVLI
jgi:serine/threonine-protein kinase prk1